MTYNLVGSLTTVLSLKEQALKESRHQMLMCLNELHDYLPNQFKQRFRFCTASFSFLFGSSSKGRLSIFKLLRFPLLRLLVLSDHSGLPASTPSSINVEQRLASSEVISLISTLFPLSFIPSPILQTNTDKIYVIHCLKAF